MLKTVTTLPAVTLWAASPAIASIVDSPMVLALNAAATVGEFRGRATARAAGAPIVAAAPVVAAYELEPVG